ncbi:MAG: 3-phosphoshikimate 1-carboxyvinyltransferase [Rhizobiales bacterium]|nr:3-phosphoshikimate 1-carboxyvinyltransferase [Hyphomicrobiales bacterium]
MPISAKKSGPFCGEIITPGDKSISHPALIFGAMARGTTSISGLLEGEDVMATGDAVAAMGAEVARDGVGKYTVTGVGQYGLRDPAAPLDLGNSGTGARLLMGLVAGQGLSASFDGDASLRSRPMGRVLVPLENMGARVSGAAENYRLPLMLSGSVPAIPIDYPMPVASAQVKSAILLAGLGAIGTTIVRERHPTRDHTERMLAHFGADIDIGQEGEDTIIRVSGKNPLSGREILVPGDPSSAAFPLAAALLAPGSDLLLPGIMINPTRAGLLTTLLEMGAEIAFLNERDAGGEPVADLHVKASALRGIEVPAARAPSMIDEYPILAILAAAATGTTIMRGLSELRVKESDRLEAVLDGLRVNGVAARADGDDLIVEGCGSGAEIPGGGIVATHMDHRIAMSFLVMGLVSNAPVTIDSAEMIATSFPDFIGSMRALGACIEEGDTGS